MKILSVKAGDIRYDVTVMQQVYAKIAEDLTKIPLASTYAIITDKKLSGLANPLALLLEEVGISVNVLHFDFSERHKTRKTKELIEDSLFELGFGRDSALIALGGGVVGDVVGFVAATYMRGIPYLEVPTTLLSQVDSSIGGKVGVDTEFGKNLVGAFWHPKKVYIDPNFLLTLPNSEVLNGLGEILKYGLIKDRSLFSKVSKEHKKILAKDLSILTDLVERSVAIKCGVVSKDPFESGYRAILNFGHTVGHAIESATNYEVPHGTAVAVGIVIEAALSHHRGILRERDFQEVISTIRLFGYPLPKVSVSQLLQEMSYDKKVRGGTKHVVLLRGIGSVATDGGLFSHPVEDRELEGACRSVLGG